MSYDRQKAVAYAHKWAHARNPAFGAFDEIGGDCANFVSQCLFAGCGAMNPAPDVGWYYRSMKNRSPSWTGVFFLHRFLTENRGRGPYGQVAPLESAQAGDVLQLAFVEGLFTHSGLVVERLGGVPGPEGILIAAHTIDSDNRPVRSYPYREARLIHILGARE